MGRSTVAGRAKSIARLAEAIIACRCATGESGAMATLSIAALVARRFGARAEGATAKPRTARAGRLRQCAKGAGPKARDRAGPATKWSVLAKNALRVTFAVRFKPLKSPFGTLRFGRALQHSWAWRGATGHRRATWHDHTGKTYLAIESCAALLRRHRLPLACWRARVYDRVFVKEPIVGLLTARTHGRRKRAM